MTCKQRYSMPTQTLLSRCRGRNSSATFSICVSFNLILCWTCILVGPACFALDNGQALTPPMVQSTSTANGLKASEVS